MKHVLRMASHRSSIPATGWLVFFWRKRMKFFLAIGLFALLVLGAAAQAKTIPPGLERQGYTLLGVCDCLSVEMRQQVFDVKIFLQENRNIRDAVMGLWMNGALECTEPDPFASTSGEASFRAALHILNGIGSVEQEVCR